MTKQNKDKHFTAGTHNWRFELHVDDSKEAPRYRIDLYRRVPVGLDELVLTGEYSGALAHAFMENDLLYEQYTQSVQRSIQDGTIKF